MKELENKEADYSFKRVTYIVVEVKLSVGATLTTDDADKLAQLFLEAIYTWHKEGKSQQHSRMVCVLTDGITWHLILTQLSCLPLS